MHNILIDKFGGSKGIRDKRALEASLARPYATFDQKDLYSTTVDKAAAIFESLIINHPFVDGNKRTAYVVMKLVLMADNLDIIASQNEKYDFVISSSKGDFKFDQIKDWLNLHVSKQ
ncbi:MAG: type II toxin-antitoxin system death-on-curing family toxin [Bacteroidia bacterium]|nr:type II toxin-antitoxin system death-on-curing family toxin [Bacteroidia bacterium]